jgi:Flp pilus assembly protein TadD
MFYWKQGRAERLFEEAEAQFAAHPEQAERLLEQSVLAAGGQFPAAQLLRCRVLGAMGRWDEALGLFSLIEDPTSCEPQELLRLAQESQKAASDALTLRALAAADRPGSEQAAVVKLRVSMEFKHGPSREVLELCRRLEQLSPEDPYPWIVEAEILRQSKESLAAVRAYCEALARKPNERQQLAIRTELVGQLIDSGKLLAAREEMDRLLANPASAESVRMKDAYLLRLEGCSEQALAQIDRVLSASPDSAAARMLRGILYFDLGRYAEAAGDLSRAAKAQPYNKEARYKLGQTYLKLNRSVEANEELEASRKLTEAEIEILALEPKLRQNRSDRVLADRLAELYEQVGRTGEARRLRDSSAD